MKEVSAGLWSRLASYLESWLLPSAAGVAFIAVVLLPRVADKAVIRDIYALDTVSSAGLFVLATLLVSFLVDNTVAGLARFLEGYTLPKPLFDWLVKRQQARWTRLRGEIAAADPEGKLRLRRRLNNFPRSAKHLLPTRLGNALRAGETYGWEQYRISTVDLWTRLAAVSDEAVLNQIQQARVRLDLFLSLIWISVALTPLTVATALWSDQMGYLWWLVLLLGLLPVWYERAVAAVGWYAQCMQAMVDLSRGKLAESMGLHLPGDIAVERRIWAALSDYIVWGRQWSSSRDWIAVINSALVPSGATQPTATAAEPGNEEPPHCAKQ